MESSFESSVSTPREREAPEQAGWVRVGFLAVTTVLASGLVAAWWYKQTISKLRQAETDDKNPHFGIPETFSADEE
jgi:hypothetical protein